MVELVAKRYVKALMTQRDNESLNSIYKELEAIASAYSDDKFLLIVSSTEVQKDDKVNLILSFVENCSDTTKNLIKLLGDNKRLDIVPSIVAELKRELAILNNKYEGVVYTNSALSDDDMAKLTSQFSTKFNVDLVLTQNICDYDGIKVEIDGLGREIGFAKSRLKAQMIDHILKAV